MFFKEFPFGVTYQHWPDPSISKEEWSKDFQRIAEHGLNHVWLSLHWAKVERKPGEYDFLDIDERVKLAKMYGLKVHLVLEGYRGGEEGPPPTWLLKAYNDLYVEENARSLPFEPKKICQNHPVVKEKVRRFFEAVAEHFKYEDAIMFYNIYWEPHFVCQCKYTMEEYVEWLKAKYGSLEKLRKAWSAPNIDDWSDIVEFKPEMGLGFPYLTCTLDWRTFCMQNLAKIIKNGAEAIRNKDPNHPVLCHPVLSMIPMSYSVMGGVDDWLIAGSVDIFGTSFYPTILTGRGSFKPEVEGWLSVEMLDALRCAAGEKPLFIAELQTHYRSRYHPLDRLSPNQLSMLCWLCVAHGAKGITMWKWRPFLRGLQLSGRGLTLHDGTPADRAEAVKEVATVLKKHSDLLLGMKPTDAEAAILFNPMTYLKLLYLSGRPETVEYGITSINGFYKALWDSHIPVDFLRPEDILEGKLNRYKILYMPFAISLEKSVAKKLVEFVERGGFLVADSPCAVTDDFEIDCYKVMPGAELDDLFSCKEVDLYAGLDAAPSRTIYSEESEEPIPNSGISIHVTASHPALPTIEVGSTLSGSLYQEELKVSPRGEVLGVFDNGSPAIIASSYGRGGAVFIGTCLGRSYFKYNEENSRRLIAGFAKWAGVMKPAEILEVNRGPIDLTLHDHKGSKTIFLINFGEKPASVKLGVRLPQDEYSCLSLMEELEVPIEYESGLLVIKADIPPLGVKAYSVKKR
ncbi:MAG: beta-galactosidase [Candidatus Brockarchaeota archaeon]|nr:beta-galactosidase [Candidatus Brockarchaeota archaeon]